MESSVVVDDNFISKYEEFLSKLKGYRIQAIYL